MSALEWGARLERERLHSSELPVAQLCAAFLNSQKLKPPYYGISDLCLFTPKSDGIPSWVCDCFASLIDSEDLPSWVMELIPLSAILAGSASPGTAVKPRLWIAKGVALIGPRAVPGGIRAGAAVSDGAVRGAVRLFDADNMSARTVIVPALSSGCYFDSFWEVAGGEDDE